MSKALTPPRARHDTAIGTGRAPSNDHLIRDYANSMFRFESLHERWIESCTSYVSHLFGEQLRDAVVIDYAFGRGNWSVAMRRAGARKVVAVDASEDNVRKFTRYCRAHRLDGIEVVHGDILQGPVGETSDIVWAYGILQHVMDADLLLGRLAALLRGRESAFYVYAYDKGSLREWVVSRARQCIPLLSEPAFRELSYLFSPAARLRARDDLTAPHIRWFGGEELAQCLSRCGLYPVRRDVDFASHQHGPALRPEFAPHHLLCTGESERALAVPDEPLPFQKDLGALSEMTSGLIESFAGHPKMMERLGVGLLNSHFARLDRKDGSSALIDDFLYLLYCVRSSGMAIDRLGAAAQRLLSLAASSMAGELNTTQLLPEDGVIARHLLANNIRI